MSRLSTLTETEVARLYRVIDHLRQRGVTIIYISHKMDEVFRLADRITVLRDGRFVQTLNKAETSAANCPLDGRPRYRTFGTASIVRRFTGRLGDQEPLLALARPFARLATEKREPATASRGSVRHCRLDGRAHRTARMPFSTAACNHKVKFLSTVAKHPSIIPPRPCALA